MSVKIFDSELKVLEVLWKEGERTAGQLAVILKERVDWNRNTTYTVIGKLIDKGAIERFGENFSCKAIITKKEVQQYETQELINKLFDGSTENFLSAFLSDSSHSAQLKEEVERLKQLVKSVKERWQINS